MTTPESPSRPDPGGVTKLLTQFLSIPSHRSCADCKSTLVDASQIYVSFRLPPSFYNQNESNGTKTSRATGHGERGRKRRIPSFAQQHHALRPSIQEEADAENDGAWHHQPRVIPDLPDEPVDPALNVPLAHGVLVCALCGAAHKLLRTSTTTVRAVLDRTAWTTDHSSPQEVQYLLQTQGNHVAAKVYEAYWRDAFPRPTAASTVAERLLFCRAKYEALAFVLPPPGPLAYSAWQRLRELHPEWEGLWGDDWCDDLDADGGGRYPSVRSEQGDDRMDGNSFSNRDYLSNGKNGSAASLLPDRLIDYFCVVAASEYLHPSLRGQDLTNATPEDLFLTPTVTDCIPTPDSYQHDAFENSRFPEHVSTFVFPDGCAPSLVPLPPSFFTLVLTNASGERLYGAVLRLYDDSKDTVETMLQILRNSQYPREQYPSWLPSNKSKGPAAQQSSSSSSDQEVLFFPKCLVLLSHYPFFDLFRKFLLQIYRIALTEAPLPMERFVVNFVCEVPLPPPGKIQVKFGFTVQDRWIIERPPENQLPLANFSFLPLFTCLSVSNILVVMGCLLQETRLILVSKHYAILGPVAEALLSLLFPFHWQGMYLPILPYSMLEILDAPVPYLVGLHARYLTKVPIEQRPAGVVIVDLDRDAVHLGVAECPSGRPRQIPSLPERHALKCKAKLIEFASMVYIPPPSLRVGTITTGAGVEIPSADRDAFAQELAAGEGSNTQRRRRDVLGPTDRAFRENELLVPISGFISEQGQLVSQKREFSASAVDTPDHTKKKFPMPRFLKSSPSAVGENGPAVSSDSSLENDSILDMIEPTGFSVHEIRHAFLRFFTSLFQSYRTYLVNGEFQAADFLSSLSLSEHSTEFVREVLKTQLFQNFVEERRDCPSDPEVLFFDDTINAKFNRSKKATLTLRKKETTFLDDTRSLVTETFTPPPPSNFGLPDDGRSYQYSTFPTLNPNLYGKIRTPAMKWNEPNRRASMGAMRRRTSILARAKEHAVVEKATRSLLRTILPKRKPRNLEGALKILSSPFHLPAQKVYTNSSHHRRADVPITSRDRSASAVSSVTLPSEFDPMDEGLLTTAEEVVLIARRKQAILIGILSILQIHCRQYFRRKQHVFVSIKGAVVSLQSVRRGMLVRCAFWMLRKRIAKVQALLRGYRVRRLFSILTQVRMQLYKKQIFLLWQKSYTPLSYRSQFWQVFSSVSLVRLSIAEQELLRLWSILRIQPSPIDKKSSISGNAGIPLGSIYQKALQVDTSLTTTASICTGGRVNNISGELTQIYDRLCLASPDRMNAMFSLFSISLSEKKKKASLTEELWMKYEEADASCKLMLEIFPELTHSISIYHVAPSKKALRRFPCAEVGPRVPDNTIPAHRKLSDHIHRAVVEVADLGLRELPARTVSLERGLAVRWERDPCRKHEEWVRRRFQNDPVLGGCATESEACVSFIRQQLPMRSFSSSSSVGVENGRSHSSIKWSDPSHKVLDPISESMAFSSSIFVSSQENFDTLAPTANGSDLAKSFADHPVPDVLVVPTSSPVRNGANRSFPRRISARLTSSFLRNDHKR